MVPARQKSSFPLGQVVSILAIAGGLLTGYSSIQSRLTGLETNSVNQEKAITETNQQVQRLNDKMDLFSREVLTELRDEKKPGINFNRKPLNILQPAKKAE